MKQIPLTQGRITLVDNDIYELVKDLKWCWRKGATKKFKGYAGKTFSADHGLSGMMFLHHVVIGYPLNGLKVDHIDGDSLNNQRSNLRLATVRQNAANLEIHRNGRLAGCHIGKSSNGRTYWRAHIRINGKEINLGNYETEQEAHEAYVTAVAQYEKTGSVVPRRIRVKTSQYIGVSWAKNAKKWRASAKINGKSKYLGHFNTEQEAHEIYLKAIENRNKQ